MRQLKTLLLAVTLTFSSVLMASTNPDDRRAESQAITTKVGKLLKNPHFILDKEIVANVTLTLNKNNELVVLSVDSDDLQIENFIKGRLNYEKLSTSAESVGKEFIVPVRVTPEE